METKGEKPGNHDGTASSRRETKEDKGRQTCKSCWNKVLFFAREENPSSKCLGKKTLWKEQMAPTFPVGQNRSLFPAAHWLSSERPAARDDSGRPRAARRLRHSPRRGAKSLQEARHAGPVSWRWNERPDSSTAENIQNPRSKRQCPLGSFSSTWSDVEMDPFVPKRLDLWRHARPGSFHSTHKLDHGAHMLGSPASWVDVSSRWSQRSWRDIWSASHFDLARKSVATSSLWDSGSQVAAVRTHQHHCKEARMLTCCSRMPYIQVGIQLNPDVSTPLDLAPCIWKKGGWRSWIYFESPHDPLPTPGAHSTIHPRRCSRPLAPEERRWENTCGTPLHPASHSLTSPERKLKAIEKKGVGHIENPRNKTSKHHKKTCFSHLFIGSTQIHASKTSSNSFSTILGRPGDLKDTADSDGRSPAESSSSSSRLAMEGNDERFGLKMWHLHCKSQAALAALAATGDWVKVSRSDSLFGISNKRCEAWFLLGGFDWLYYKQRTRVFKKWWEIWPKKSHIITHYPMANRSHMAFEDIDYTDWNPNVKSVPTKATIVVTRTTFCHLVHNGRRLHPHKTRPLKL